jgi:hypothetical protein
VPDQSLSNDAVSGKTGQEAGNPADTSANSPTQATPESQASNVNRASDGEKQQADVTINQDPTVSSGDEQTVGTEGRQASAPTDAYDDEEQYKYRDLQQLAKDRDIDASGKRDEIVARLREADQSGGSTGDAVPRGDVDPTNVENGGIQRTDRGQQHAEVLQGLSDERKSQQLAAIKDRAQRSDESVEA